MVASVGAWSSDKAGQMPATTPITLRLIRVLRYRHDDPLRYLHVFGADRLGEDYGVGANALVGGDDTDGLERCRRDPGALVSEDRLA